MYMYLPNTVLSKPSEALHLSYLWLLPYAILTKLNHYKIHVGNFSQDKAPRAILLFQMNAILNKKFTQKKNKKKKKMYPLISQKNHTLSVPQIQKQQMAHLPTSNLNKSGLQRLQFRDYFYIKMKLNKIQFTMKLVNLVLALGWIKFIIIHVI